MSLLPTSGASAAGILGLSVAALLALLVLSPVLGGGDWRRTWIVEERARIELDRARERTEAPAPARASVSASAPIVLASTRRPGATAPGPRSRPARRGQRAGATRRRAPSGRKQQAAPVAATPPAAVAPAAPPAQPALAEAPAPPAEATPEAAPEQRGRDDVESPREPGQGRDAEGTRERERDRASSDLERRASRVTRKPVQVSLEPERSHPAHGDDSRGGPPPGRPASDDPGPPGRGKRDDGRGRKR
jgi:hypothetical protein